MKPLSDPIRYEPFVAWFDERSGEDGVEILCQALGWEGDTGTRRLNRWRTERPHDGHTERALIEDALHRVGVALWELAEPTPAERQALLDRAHHHVPTREQARLLELFDAREDYDVDDDLPCETRWCPACHDQSPVGEDGRCLFCDGATKSDVTRGFHHATLGRITYTVSPERAAAIAEQKRAKVRLVSAEGVELARAMYQDDGKTMREAAQAVIARGLLVKVDDARAHRPLEIRVEEVLRQWFHRQGYAMRTTAESLRGQLCRTEKRCQHTNQRGKPCGGNVIRHDDGTYGDLCWQHDPSYADRRDAIAHMERMRARRRWLNEVVPLAPLIEWATERAAELAPAPGTKVGCYAGRGGWAELARRTGVAVSTWGKWRQGKSSKGTPKDSLTERKAREILERDGTTTFEALYERESEQLAA